MAPAKLATAWFGDTERSKAASLASITVPIGSVLGFGIPSSIVKNDDKFPENHVRGIEHFEHFQLLSAILVTVLTVPAILLSRSNPPSPPSSSSKVQSIPIRESLPKMLKNCNFVLLLFTYCTAFSNFLTIGSVVGQYTDKYGRSSDDVSVFGVS